VSLATTSPQELPLTGTALTTTLSRAPRLDEMPGLLGRAAGFVGELLALVGIVCCIPFVILAIGSPIALAVRLLLWVGGML
jgi:hypothetical protein